MDRVTMLRTVERYDICSAKNSGVSPSRSGVGGSMLLQIDGQGASSSTNSADGGSRRLILGWEVAK